MTIYKLIAATLLTLMSLSACKGDETITYDDIETQKAGYSKRIAELGHPAMQETLQRTVYEIAFLQEIALSNERPLEDIAYVSNPFAWIDDYASVDDMVLQYVAGLIPMTKPSIFRGDANVHQSFPFPYRSNIIWSEVLLSDGTVSSVSNDPFPQGEVQMEARNGGRSIDMVAEGPDVPLPTQLRGQIELLVPEAATRLSFTRDELGKPKTFGDFTVTMTSLSQTHVILDVSDQTGGANSYGLNPLEVSATDHTGQFLNSNASSRGPAAPFLAALIEAFEAILTAAEKGDLTGDDVAERMQQDVTEVRGAFGSTYSVQANFEGAIETVEVVLAKGAEKRSFPLDLAVHEMTSSVEVAVDFMPPDIPTSAVAYAHEFEYLTAPNLVKELAPDQLEYAITPLSSIFWDGQERIKLFYPPNVASSLSLGLSGRLNADTAQVRFLNGSGKLVKPQPTYELQSGRLEFTVDEAAERPKRVAATLDVRLMSGMEIQTFDATTLPDGVAINGNQISLPPSDARVFAIDEAGRFLRRFHRLEVKDGWDVTRVVEYYYGAPAGIVMVTEGPLEPHPYSFEVELALPDPKE